MVENSNHSRLLESFLRDTSIDCKGHNIYTLGNKLLVDALHHDNFSSHTPICTNTSRLAPNGLGKSA